MLEPDLHQTPRHAPGGAEVRQLIGAVRETRFQVAFALIYHCGLRLNELCRLRVRDLDPERGMLRVIDGKGGKYRQVPVSPDLFALGGSVDVVMPARWAVVRSQARPTGLPQG